MSLIRMVLRMSAVAAVRGRTWAENRVYDSDNTPLIDALASDTKPYVTVFTDSDTMTEISGRDVYTGNRQISLVFEFGIASAAVVENKGVILNIPQTDQAMEALIDILETQIIDAAVTDPYSEFGEIIRSMVNKFYRVPSVRGGAEERGTRWAARQLTLLCDTISDPAPGTVLPDQHPIRQFITLAKSPTYASLGMAEAADLVDRVLNGSPSPDWRQAQAWLGLTTKAMQGIGMAPLPEGDEQPRKVSDLVFDGEDDTIQPFPVPVPSDDM